MTIEETIQKAIEGGYKAYPKPFCQECGNYVPMESKNQNIFLDPTFWQSLGKAMGWTGRESVDASFCEAMNGWHQYQERWLYQWHQFIDHLAEGKDIESFFNPF